MCIEDKTEYTIDDVAQHFKTMEQNLERLLLQHQIAIFEDELRMHIQQTGAETGCCDQRRKIYCDVTRFLDRRIQELKQALQGGQNVH
ncbi:MAG: hypothetical protein AB2693_34210 [Candidatus Thiodiazotropha sp.]